MNKLSIAVLLFSSLYLATALSDAPWVPISRGIFENSPFTQGLNIIGTLNNLGQAYDSGIFNARAGDATTVYNAWQQTDDDGAFTYIAEPLLALADGNAHDSKYAVRIDPETGRRDVVWWSIQQLLEENFVPTGRNITYDADTDTVTVTSFDGIEQFVEYQRFQPLNETNTPPTNDTTDVVVDPNENTEVIVDPAEDAEVVVDDGENSEVVVDGEDNEVVVDADDDVDVIVNGTNNTSNTPTVQVYNSFSEYLRDFVGYEERDVNDLNGDEFLDNAVARAIGQLAEDGNLANVNLTNVNTLNTILDQDRNTLVRIAGDITSDTHNGNIVAVIFCAVDSNCDAGDLQYWWWNSILNGGESQ